MDLIRFLKLLTGADIMERETKIKDIRDDFFRYMTEELYDTYTKKNEDYGGSFTDLYETYGDIVGVIHMKEKLNRFESLTKTDGIGNYESQLDTLLDLAGYALLCATELMVAEMYENNGDEFIKKHDVTERYCLTYAKKEDNES